MFSVAKTCKDCLAEWQIHTAPAAAPSDPWPMPKAKIRPAPHPGPRCATHWRIEKKRRETAAHDKRVSDTYGLEPGEYAKLYKYQGGVCGWCGRATGATRRLSLDHDHKTGEPRGLLCRPCNTHLGYLRDEPVALARGYLYIIDPPAQRMRNEHPSQ